MKEFLAAFPVLLSLTIAACGSGEESPGPIDEGVARTTAGDPAAAYAACRYDIEATLFIFTPRFPSLVGSRATPENASRVNVEVVYSSDEGMEGYAIAYVEGPFEVEGRPWAFQCLADLIIDEDGLRRWDVAYPATIAPRIRG